VSCKPACEGHGRAAENSGLSLDALPSSSPCPAFLSLPPAACGLHALTYSVRQIKRPPSNGNGVVR
jgi:hypothetical protein